MYTFMYTRAYMVVYVVNAYLCHWFVFDCCVRVRVHVLVRTCMLQDLFPTMKQSYGTDLCSPDSHSVTVYKRYVLLSLAKNLALLMQVTVCVCVDYVHVHVHGRVRPSALFTSHKAFSNINSVVCGSSSASAAHSLCFYLHQVCADWSKRESAL